jgi:hypothetical protein
LLVSREKKTTGESQQIYKVLAERRKLSEQGIKPPVCIYAEGCTSNGAQVLMMRRGAFEDLGSIKPYAQTTWSLTGVQPTSGNVMSTPAFFALFMHGLVSLIFLSEMPVFKPNDYFWKHHWDGKEEKWITYSRAIQKVIADEMGVKVSQSSLIEKFEYKALKKKKTKKD